MKIFLRIIDWNDNTYFRLAVHAIIDISSSLNHPLAKAVAFAFSGFAVYISKAKECLARVQVT